MIQGLTTDEKYIQRCLQLARNGQSNARPNPMVGAVIVYNDSIIGEGYHICSGEGHAEVNAFADCEQRGNNHLLKNATIYVSLEPCSHYGKTPPCADLIIRKGIKRVVVGCIDSFSEVSGRGIKRIRDAGIEVIVGICEKECLELNKTFFTFHNLHRPYITLKWAQSQDGFIDKDFIPTRISNEKTIMLSHKLRAEHDAILVGRITEERDNPKLNIREWAGKNPQKLVLSHKNLDTIKKILEGKNTESQREEDKILHIKNIHSLLVEGGAKAHQYFIENNLWDTIRIETSQDLFFNGTKAIQLPQHAILVEEHFYSKNTIKIYKNTTKIHN